MEEWKEYRLDAICNLSAGGDAPRNAVKKPIGDMNIPIYSNGESEKGLYGYTNTYKIEAPAVTISARGNIGFVCYRKENFVPIVRLITAKANEQIVSNEYLYYCLCNTHIWGDGSVQKQLTVPMISGYFVKVPSLTTQYKIVSILKSLDDKIEVNRRINENLEQQAQALFKSWFVDFEPFKECEFVESELGMIPKGWRVGKLEEMCSFISRGLTPKYDDGSDELILGQTCVRNNIVTLNNARKHKPKNKTEKWVQQWDVLINSTGIGSLGRVGIVYFQKNNVAIDSHITVVRTSNPLYRHYVGRNLLNRQLEIEKMAVGSTGQTELPRDSVKAMPIVIPFDKVMKRFNCIIEPMALAMYRNIEENSRLASLRDTLLPRLMSGEIRVDEINSL